MKQGGLAPEAPAPRAGPLGDAARCMRLPRRQAEAGQRGQAKRPTPCLRLLYPQANISRRGAGGGWLVWLSGGRTGRQEQSALPLLRARWARRCRPGRTPALSPTATLESPPCQPQVVRPEAGQDLLVQIRRGDAGERAPPGHPVRAPRPLTSHTIEPPPCHSPGALLGAARPRTLAPTQRRAAAGVCRAPHPSTGPTAAHPSPRLPSPPQDSVPRGVIEVRATHTLSAARRGTVRPRGVACTGRSCLASCGAGTIECLGPTRRGAARILTHRTAPPASLVPLARPRARLRRAPSRTNPPAHRPSPQVKKCLSIKGAEDTINKPHAFEISTTDDNMFFIADTDKVKGKGAGWEWGVGGTGGWVLHVWNGAGGGVLSSSHAHAGHGSVRCARPAQRACAAPATRCPGAVSTHLPYGCRTQPLTHPAPHRRTLSRIPHPGPANPCRKRRTGSTPSAAPS
jgi:hypothetical protein